MLNKLIQCLCLVLILGIYTFNYLPTTLDYEFMVFIFGLVAVSIVSFLVLRDEVLEGKKQFIRISYIFILSLLIVHFQVYLDFLLGNLQIDNNFLWVDKAIVMKSLVLSAIGTISYIFGYSFNNKIVRINRSQSVFTFLDTKYLFFLGCVFIVGFYLTVNPRYLQGHYGSEEVGGVAQTCALFFESCIFAIVIINCRNQMMKNINSNFSLKDYLKLQRHAIILLSIYLPTVIVIGDRGPVIYLSLCCFFGYIYITKRHIPLITIFILLMTASVTMTVMGLVRRQDKDMNYSSRFSGALNDTNALQYYPESFSNNTKELAASVRTLHLAVSNVPKPIPHFYGLFFSQDIMLLVPSLRSTFVKFFDIPYEFSTSPRFLTYLSLGRFATWGVGTSCIADTYLDFGMFGILIVYLLFGYISRNMELISFSRFPVNLLVTICVFLFFSFCLYIPRSTIISALSKFTYIAAFCYIPYLSKNKVSVKFNP